jgi:electron transport complex protein RnfC
MMHIESMKKATKSRRIESVREPNILLIPLFEKFGSKPKPIVKVGDEIRRYQVVGESQEGFSAKVHSPVSGKVIKIEELIQIDGSKAQTIFIENDKKNAEMVKPLSERKDDSPEEILRLIEEAGVVGAGGAQFPTAMKYNRKGKRVDTFIINGAECEPYLTGDFALMNENAKEILEGILIVDKILEAREIVIAIEKSNQEIILVFEPYLQKEEHKKIRIQIVPNEYPQGGELQLTKTVTGIEIARGDIPLDKGIIVSNVGTVFAVYEAIIKGKPLVERVITISGEHIKKPGNYRIKIGTTVNDILDMSEIDPVNTVIVAGGPMMSPQVFNPLAPLHKGSLGILALPKKHVERLNCIWCGYCVDVCPMNLMPMKYEQFYRYARYDKLNKYSIMDCIECGACEYICPSNVPLIKSIKEGKVKLKEITDAVN